MRRIIPIYSWYNIFMHEEKAREVIADIARKLGEDFDGVGPHFYTDGWTGAIVFDLAEKYLVKITNSETIETQAEFLKHNPDGVFQNVCCFDYDYGYICFDFIKGEKYADKPLEAHDAIRQVAKIAENFREYPHEGYGFLHHEFKTWREFLADEVEYARGCIPAISTEKVYKALEAIGDAAPKQYLLHGDFGAHNFLVDDGKIRVIDPMPAVGDFLYDFYFAILSDTDIFTKVGREFIYSFFERDESEKEALLKIALYVRMSRAFKYDIENFDAYLKMYEEV